MRRRAFIALACGGAVAWPLAARAQQRSGPSRVAYLFSLSEAEGRHLWEACREGLHDIGYVEGRNIVLDVRWVAGHYERLPEVLAEFERLNVDVIVIAATPGNVAARLRTSTIPVVFVAVADPLKAGLVASLAKPGGRFTGLSLLTPELSGKRLELLAESVPNLARVAILLNPGNLSNFVFLEETRIAARRLGIELKPLEVRNPAEVERAIGSAIRDNAGALIAFDDPVIHSDRAQIIALTAKHRLPAMYGTREFADEGGLMTYGPNRADLYRRSATFVDKILKGAKPADLAVEQPARFELIVNRKTAIVLGLDLPTSLLLRANEVIE
jgi:putative ABC transport system substrate-binding protein